MHLKEIAQLTITGLIAGDDGKGTTFLLSNETRFFVDYAVIVDEQGGSLQPEDLTGHKIEEVEYSDGELSLTLDGGDIGATFLDVEDLTDNNGNGFDEFLNDSTGEE